MSTNPILREEEMAGWRVSARRPIPKGNASLVFVDGRGQVHAAKQAVTLGEAVWGNLRRLYEVDTAEHDASFSGQLPCQEKGFSFDFTIQLSWQVHLPDQIVRDGRRDVAPLYTRYLTELCKEHSEEYGLEQRDQAERKLSEELVEPLVLPEGITLRRCSIDLSLGDEAEAHVAAEARARFDANRAKLAHEARVQDARYATAEKGVTHELDILVGTQRGEHKRRQLDLEAELAEQRYKLEKLEADHKLALARQQADFQMALQADRMTMYAQALSTGDLGLIPLVLAQNPADAVKVLDLALEQRHVSFEQSRQLVATLLDADLVSGADLDPAKQTALRTLLGGLGSEALDAALGGDKTQAIAERAGPIDDLVDDVVDAVIENGDDDDDDDDEDEG